MKKVNYFEIIHRYIPPDSRLYGVYIPHVTLVTAKALAIGKRLKLTEDQLQFIEEAAMLHDIGVIKVKAPEIGCQGELPYICHISEGRKILEAEGLARHAVVAETHIGVGLTEKEIILNQLPLPARDMIPHSLEEKIICYADLFFGKHPRKIWYERSVEHVKATVKTYGDRQYQHFLEWHDLFTSSS
ncbi:MAG: HD domain-containing protein [Gemmatimonadetes bacterium]|nr:MAG: HD domain-containing protein [Gemmatimonadota bacterium]